MKQALFGIFLVYTIILFHSVSSTGDNGLPRCSCEDERTLWSIERVMECQRVSDFLIAVAYFSIPIELLYFISCSNIPFKWVLFEFIAFIVLCGMTHLLNGWTYGPHAFQLILALTVFKILTALVSCATAITLFTLIPMLLKVKVREFMLRKKTWDLGREVGIIMKQREAGLHVRMLTQVIRNSLDRHTILDTTLVELSKMLSLQNCAIWMPDEMRTVMNLTHSLTRSDGVVSLPIADPDVAMVKQRPEVVILRYDSALASASSGKKSGELGFAAAIRMPMFKVANFKVGTPEMVKACYAILVLVLPPGEDRNWTDQELEMVQVVADQVAVAISHAAILEESQLMREKLEVQNLALQQAKKNAMMAREARIAFQKVMSDGMRKPMHSIIGLISLMQEGESELSSEQRVILDAMMKTSTVFSTIINDAMEITSKETSRFPLEIKPFDIQSTIRDITCTARCLCAYNGLNFSSQIQRSLPSHVIGDERRLVQVVLHMIGNLLADHSNSNEEVLFALNVDADQTVPDRDVCIRIEIGKPGAGVNASVSDCAKESVDSVCSKLVKMMEGKVWGEKGTRGNIRKVGLAMRFKVEHTSMIDDPHSNTLLRGMEVMLVDGDSMNRAVTGRYLERLGCRVAAVSSGFDCLSAVTPVTSAFRVVILDLQMPDLDGFEIATRIRKFRSPTWPLIVAMTASFHNDIWDKCHHAGMNGIVRKPVMMQGIASELRRVLLQANNVV